MMLWLLVLLVNLLLVQSATVITVDWSNVTYTSNTYATLQVVTNPLYERTSPIHNSTFTALANIELEYVRFQGWHPYPQLVVAELQPPTGNPVCASVAANQVLYLACYEGTFESIDFASFGTPQGRCQNFTAGECSSEMAAEIVGKYCLGKQSCYVNATSAIFGPNCSTANMRLAVQATCSQSVNMTFWNFTLLDPFFEDFMVAQQNRSIIVNYCTSPEWLWNTNGPIAIPSDPNEIFWNYKVGTDLRDASYEDITNYYVRLFQWYTAGGFKDEYGQYHKSGYYYNIPMFELFNEFDALGHTVQSYTAIYDAITVAIKAIAPNTEFVGLALASASRTDWLEYFLNPTNHLPNAPLDWISYHFYASPNSRSNSSSFLVFFPQADGFLAQVAQNQAIRSKLAPWVKTDIDELGVILPGDIDPNAGPIAPIYWNAAGAMFAYIYGNIIKLGVEVLGCSQMIGYPVQYPSVSMMDWVTGKPNSRYWVLYLLKNSFEVGDKLVLTQSSQSNLIYAQGFITSKGNKILVVSKSNTEQTVTVSGLTSATMEYVDLTTFESPPASMSVANSTFVLNAFAVAVLSNIN